jgi:peptidoglycan hydrolase-like protein with peptidoglycan-binding domain
MAELPAPRPGAPVQALRTKMTEPPARKSDSKRSTPTTREAELPKPSEAAAKEKVAQPSAKTEPKPAQAKATPTATPKIELPYRAEVAKAQELLLKLKQFEGKADGKLGPITQAAITAYQKKNGLSSKGEPDSATISKLEKEVEQLATKSDAKAGEVAAVEKPATEIKITDTKPGATATKAASVPKADDPQFVVLRKTQGAPMKSADIGPVPRMTKVAEVKKLQEKLSAAKVYSDAPDGKWGHKTIVAMKEFQEKNGLEVTGKPNKETWQKLNDVAGSGEWEVAAPKAAPANEAKSEKAEKISGIVITDAKTTKRPASKAPLTIAVTQAAVGSTADSKKQDKPSAPGEHKVIAPAPAKESAAVTAPDAPEATSSAAVDELPVSKPAAALASTPGLAADKDETNKTKAAPSNISDSEVPSLSGNVKPVEPGAEVVVKLNADAAASDNQSLATPATVSQVAEPEITPALADPTKPVLLAPPPEEAAKRAGTTEEVAVSVKAPKREGRTETTDAGESKAEIKTAPVTEDKPIVVAAAAPVKASAPVDTDSAMAAPKTPAAVKIDEAELPPVTSKVATPAAKSEVSTEKTKQDGLKEKASEKVEQVEAIYKQVKQRYGDVIAKSAKGKKSEEALKLADLMTKIDAGYTAMKADFQKGNYEPIVERCDGFKLQIEILGNEAAKDYVETALEKNRSKLPKDTLTQIEDLRTKNKFMDAATMLEEASKSKPSASTKRKS